MEKSKRQKSVEDIHSHGGRMRQPSAVYSRTAQVKDFAYSDFKKIADKVAISQQEWSDLLHISERTLQRYAKSNGIFSFGVTDRILQIEKVISKGEAVFGSVSSFLEWLRSGPRSLEGDLSLQSLSSIDGIQQVLVELGRIEQGLFA